MGIGKRLKEAREHAGLSQMELARKIGVTGSAITNYEKEISHPKESVMYALMDALNVEPNFLFQDCVKTLKENAPHYSSEALRIAKRFDELDEYGQSAVSGLVNVEYERCTALPNAKDIEELVQRGAALIREQAEEEETQDVSASYANASAAG